MAHTPANAVIRSLTITRGYVGLCLVLVRTFYGIGAKYPSASEAWRNAKGRHFTDSLKNVPVGAPVFFHIPSNKFGHVALYLGDGKLRTNWSAAGAVITASLKHPVFNTMLMLGWSDDLNGVDLGLEKPAPKTYTVRKGDTLSGIGATTGKNWKTLAKLNDIPGPKYIIQPGQKLKLG